MNTQKTIIGQALLWAGFLSAALATITNLEFDLLPQSEKDIIWKLNKDLSLPKSFLDEMTTTQVADLTEPELASVVEQANQLFTAQQAAAKEAEQAANSVTPPTDSGDEQKAKTPEPQVSRNTIIAERLTRIENKWPTVRWIWYALSMAVGVAGVVLLRSSSKSVSQGSTLVIQQLSTVTESLDRLMSSVTRLQTDLDKLKPAEVVEFIDDTCADDFASFADARSALIHRFGLQAYADIMTEFASAERFVNRSWSAAADGYMNEVRVSVARAESHLKQASQLLNKHLTDADAGNASIS